MAVRSENPYLSSDLGFQSTGVGRGEFWGSIYGYRDMMSISGVMNRVLRFGTTV